jgi:3'-5' exoribonuclease
VAATAENGTTIASLRAGGEIAGVYACSRKDRLTTRAGAPYLALELRDRSGAIGARVFRDADFLAGRFDRGDLIHVRGRVERFRDELQAELIEIRRATPEEADPADFLPRAYRDLDELDGFWDHLAGEVYDADLKRLVDAFGGDADFRAEFRRAPCTRGGHHSYLGGLLEHTVAVATLVLETCALHPRLDSDLLMAAAILHDVGRAREFTYGAEFGLSEEGRLLGHLAIGAEVVGAAAAGLPAERRLALLNCVLSHHGPDAGPGRAQAGRRGGGASHGFASAEALALYRLNALDASVKAALEHGPPS